MRRIDLSRPASACSEGVARRTRHLTARLMDFGPGGPEILVSDPNTGRVSARFHGQEPLRLLETLSGRYGISAALEEGAAVFYLSPDVSFEELDYVWGCLFELL